MRPLHFFAIVILTLSTQANANVLHFQNIARDWTPHNLEPGSPESKMAREGIAILNYRETRKSIAATVYVNEYPLPSEKLGNDKAAWHNLMFPGPATVKAKILSEGVVNVNGQWRYIIHFETEAGTGLQSVAMATIISGKLHVFLVEQHRDIIGKLTKPIFQLYKNVAIVSTSH